MPRGLKPIKRQLALMLINDFESAPDIAKHVKCCERTVYYYKANMKLYDQPRPISVSRKGPVKKMTEESIEVYVLLFSNSKRLIHKGLLAYLDEKPTAYLDEMKWYLWDFWEIDISESTISRTLKARGWSRKVVNISQMRKHAFYRILLMLGRKACIREK